MFTMSIYALAALSAAIEPVAEPGEAKQQRPLPEIVVIGTSNREKSVRIGLAHPLTKYDRVAPKIATNAYLGPSCHCYILLCTIEDEGAAARHDRLE